MTREQMVRARELFEAAVDEPPADLDLWLDRAGVADATIRAEVASLLANHARAGSFLAAPAPDAASRVLGALDRVLPPGTVVGPYVVRREIGRGGMGRVYVATDSRLERDVALKAIAPEYADDERYRARLRREARAAAALTDPGVCATYALEEIDGQLFIVSELVEGRTLRQAIDAGARPSPEQALSAARALAAALADAHAHGMIHRDLTPPNVMLRADGRVKVLDFGLAALRGDRPADAPSSRAGALAGTPAYMAPEQLNGGTVDAAADVFAFGVVMYEWITGVHPFHAPTALAMAARVLEAEPAPIDALRPDAPPTLVAAIERCLAKAPARRFADARELAAALADGQAAGAVPRQGGVARAWWRTHQLAIVVLYVAACVAAWSAGEFLRLTLARSAFVVLAALATAGGVMRGHLLFTERVHPARARDEAARTRRMLLATDLVIALMLAALGAAATSASAPAAVVALALAVGIALAALLIEPATSGAAGLSG